MSGGQNEPVMVAQQAADDFGKFPALPRKRPRTNSADASGSSSPPIMASRIPGPLPP